MGKFDEHTWGISVSAINIGEMLRWGGNDEGEQGLAAVAVECTPEQCTRCGFDEDAEYEIAIEFDVIRGVTGPTTIYRPTP